MADDFKILFVVIIFHRRSFSVLFLGLPHCSPETFEGLGLGSRLAYLVLPRKFNWVPIAAALLFAVTTPLGIAVGLGVKSTYNPGSTTASIVSGVLDSLSAGILIYTGLVEVCEFFPLMHPC